MMTYSEVINALKATGIPFQEAAWRNAEKLADDYGVYALDDDNSLIADGKHAERFFEGTIDYFARKTNGRINAAKIEKALDNVDVPWYLNGTPQYENDTGYTHYEWVYYCLGADNSWPV